MIKTPGSRTDRIAQACDRCRSKKIRCDGLRPNCSQCVAVGFECKISDKLTRRAFPRGYTESLEDRIRQLESDNKRLSDLLEIKDEQMEMLSRVETTLGGHQHAGLAPTTVPTTGTTRSSCVTHPDVSAFNTPTNTATATTADSSPSDGGDDELHYITRESTSLDSNGMFVGASSGKMFVNALGEKLHTKGYDMSVMTEISKMMENINIYRGGATKSLGQSLRHHSSGSSTALGLPPTPDSVDGVVASNNSNVLSSFPGRSLCDKLVTIYFEEWQSVYSIVDRDSFLKNYTCFLDEQPITCDTDCFVATFSLILLMAHMSCRDKIGLLSEDVGRLESEYKAHMARASQQWNLESLTVLCLSLLYSLHVGNTSDVWRYRSLSVSMALRLGLHKNVKGANDMTRRRIFWLVYALDVFCSATQGSPRLFDDHAIECPFVLSEVDDVGLVNEGETSCQMSFLAFSRILARILDTVYNTGQKMLTFKTLVSLDDELESWWKDLPMLLKFEFSNGAPSARLSPVHQKAPLLLMLFQYARILIHMPSITATNDSNTTRASPSNVTMTQSAKTYLQIYDYLKKRCVTPTLPLNSVHMIALLGGIVTYSAVDYSKGGALLHQTRKLLNGCMRHLEEDRVSGYPGAISRDTYTVLEHIFETCLNNHTEAPAKKASVSRSSPKADKTVRHAVDGSRSASMSSLLTPEQELYTLAGNSLARTGSLQEPVAATPHYSVLSCMNGLNTGKLLEDIISLNLPYRVSPSASSTDHSTRSFSTPMSTNVPIKEESETYFDHSILDEFHGTSTNLDNFNWGDFSFGFQTSSSHDD